MIYPVLKHRLWHCPLFKEYLTTVIKQLSISCMHMYTVGLYMCMYNVDLHSTFLSSWLSCDGRYRSRGNQTDLYL